MTVIVVSDELIHDEHVDDIETGKVIFGFAKNEQKNKLKYKKTLTLKVMNTKLEQIATYFLENAEIKQNFSNRDFMNALVIFQTAIMDKMYDNQEYDKMILEDRITMVNKCGNEIHKLIHTYTGLDTHDVYNFI